MFASDVRSLKGSLFIHTKGRIKNERKVLGCQIDCLINYPGLTAGGALFCSSNSVVNDSVSDSLMILPTKSFNHRYAYFFFYIFFWVPTKSKTIFMYTWWVTKTGQVSLVWNRLSNIKFSRLGADGAVLQTQLPWNNWLREVIPRKNPAYF